MLLLARTSPLNQGIKKTDGLSVFLLDMQEAKKKGVKGQVELILKNLEEQEDA